MALKLNSLARWSVLMPGEGIIFNGSDDGERRVRVNFNCERPTVLYIVIMNVERFLVALPAGLETVEFNVRGNFRIVADKEAGEVHFQSADLEPTFSENVDPVIFTRIANRRHRNPELEEIMWRMQANMERRLAQQADEIESAFERRRKEFEDARAAEAANNQGSPAQAAGAEVPAQGAAGEGGGADAGSPPAGE